MRTAYVTEFFFIAGYDQSLFVSGNVKGSDKSQFVMVETD